MTDDSGTDTRRSHLTAREAGYLDGKRDALASAVSRGAAHARLVEAAREARSCLAELHALVVGECPRLLNEDSGGDAGLAFAFAPPSRRWTVADRDREAARLAQAFHEAYERLAPSFGYETRKASARPWVEVPEPNRKLMEAVCAEVMVPLLASERAAATAACAEVVTTCYRCHASLIAEDQPRCIDQCGFDDDIETEPLALDVAIRALSPEGWVGVRRDTLLTWSERVRTAERSFGSLLDLTLIRDVVADIDRAALARGKGA